jgi:iron-sulfur cluster assembly accessory protein
MILTPAAERFIRRMMRFSVGADAGFRIKVRPGGCSGFAVEFDLADQPAANEAVWKDSDLRIFIDPASCLLLNEAVVDFVESRSVTGFVVTSPGGPASTCAPSSTLLPVDILTRR